MNFSEVLKLKHPNSGLNEWLDIFNLAFVAAKDVLDELKYRKLEDMVTNRDHVSRSFSSILGSLKRKFLGCNINGDTLGRLREAIKMLDLATLDVGLFFQFATALRVHRPAEQNFEADNLSSRETTSFLTESKVFGRENERTKVIEWLKKPASHAHISALCIVGAGGLGKTTLAQLIHEKMNNGNYFDKIIWVCVSTCFSVQHITRKILEELGQKNHSDESLNGLQKSLKQWILSKKVLLILYDVWNDDKICDWEKLITPLKFVQEGSKILVTTRMKSVTEMIAHVLNVQQECLNLRGLEEQDLLLLFNKYAFHGSNCHNHKDLQEIGNDIVMKLRGSPLAAKVIGSSLNSNMNLHYWKRILRFDSLMTLEQARNVADVLKLSYYHLSADLQECFRFCSIFPQDYEFEKNRLIRMWVASGFIRQQSWREEIPEDIGEEYFHNLLNKSFCEPHPAAKDCYIMHDLMHELAPNVSEGECCRVELNGKSINIPSTTRYVSVHECEIEKVVHLGNLRTLMITISKNEGYGSRKERVVKPAQFVLPNGSVKEALRVLVINVNYKCSFQLPEEIGSLIHLCYLTIGGGNKDTCPHSMYKLHHLQVLEWYGANFETSGITNRVNLRYIELPIEMMKNIKGVHKLTFLQKLTFFVGKEKGQHIDELKMLKNLRRLSIRKIDNVIDPTDAMNARLSKKENLISLSLNWTRSNNADNSEQIIDNLKPHSNVKELIIENYKGHMSPLWMKDLPPLDLSSLELLDCSLWEDLPLLAQMPHLRKLTLHRMDEVKEVDYSFDSTRNYRCPFPSLEELCCGSMPKWQSWAGSVSYYGFPNLTVLKIRSCPNLTELPPMPLSLHHFEVMMAGLNSLPDIYNSSSISTTVPSSLKSSLRQVVIVHCPNLKSLNGFLQQDNIDLRAIRALTIFFF